MWTQQGNKLVGGGAVGAAQQGVSVALSADGNTAIIGGPRDNSFVGAAWVFTRNAGVWTQYGNKLVGTGAVGAALVKAPSVALSADGNTAIIGGHERQRSDRSGVGVYPQQRGVDATRQQAGRERGGWSGPVKAAPSRLSADGNTAIIGGSMRQRKLGAAWVFTRSDGVWTQQGSKLVGSGAVGAAQQGASVALSADGSTAIIGGSGDNGTIGAAWVWLRPAAHDLNADGKSDIVWRQ